MGIRFTMFAIDLNPFNEFSSKSVESFFEWAKTSGADGEDLLEFVGTDGATHLVSNQVEGYSLKFNSFSHQSVKHFLEQQWSGSLSGFLSILAKESSIPFVHSVTDNKHKRWWLGSLLKSMKASVIFNDTDLEKTAFLASKLLRYYDCDFPIPHDSGLSRIDFPILPLNDLDWPVGCLNQEDLETLWSYLQMFSGSQTQFIEWKDWLSEISKMILNIQDLNYESPRLISFLG